MKHGAKHRREEHGGLLRIAINQLPRLRTSIALARNNPIYKREMLYQRRSIPRFVQVIDSVGIVGCVLALSLWLINVMVHVFAAYYGDGFDLLFTWAQSFVWVIHALVAVRTIVAGVQVIHRDDGSLNWDDLRLLNLSPFTYLLGKWQAVVHQMRGWLLALGIIYLTLVGVLAGDALLTSYTQAIYHCHQDVMLRIQLDTCADLDGEIWQGWYRSSGLYMPLAAALTVFYSVLEVATCAAIGIASAVLLRTRGLALLVAIAARFAPVLIFGTWPYNGWTIITPTDLVERSNLFTGFSLADSGTSAILRVFDALWWGNYRELWLSNIITSALFGLMFVAAVIIALTATWFKLRR